MAGRLKPLDVEREEKPGKYADGDGLYLIFARATSKSWLYRYWFEGKERWFGLGSVRNVSLKEARLARDAARLLVRVIATPRALTLFRKSAQLAKRRNKRSRKRQKP